MELASEHVMELLDWRPDTPVWCQEWRDLYDRCPPGGWRRPAPGWIEWARGVLEMPLESYQNSYLNAIARILSVAEPLHPQGLERRRLQESLAALGQLHGQDYPLADWLIDSAEKTGIVRTERVDRWRPGMRSGSGLRAYCRLTLYGKSLLKAGAMPEPFPPEPEPAWRSRPATVTPPFNWLERQMARIAPAAARAAQPPARETPPTPAATPATEDSPCTIPPDFVWHAHYVDQQVCKYFRKHREKYERAVLAVVNDEMKMEQFGRDFGPAKISDWINQLLKITNDHPKPCSVQSVYGSATYRTLVKAFKDDPRNHPIIARLQHGQSDGTQAILDAFLVDEEPGS